MDCRAGNSIWLINALAEPDLVAGFQDFGFLGVEGEEAVYRGLGDAVLIVIGIVPKIIIAGDDGTGFGETESEDGVFQNVDGGVAAVNIDEVVGGEGQSAQSFAPYAGTLCVFRRRLA